jgi:hypothetical protein
VESPLGVAAPEAKVAIVEVAATAAVSLAPVITEP